MIFEFIQITAIIFILYMQHRINRSVTASFKSIEVILQTYEIRLLRLEKETKQ